MKEWKVDLDLDLLLGPGVSTYGAGYVCDIQPTLSSWLLHQQRLCRLFHSIRPDHNGSPDLAWTLRVITSNQVIVGKQSPRFFFSFSLNRKYTVFAAERDREAQRGGFTRGWSRAKLMDVSSSSAEEDMDSVVGPVCLPHDGNTNTAGSSTCWSAALRIRYQMQPINTEMLEKPSFTGFPLHFMDWEGMLCTEGKMIPFRVKKTNLEIMGF